MVSLHHGPLSQQHSLPQDLSPSCSQSNRTILVRAAGEVRCPPLSLAVWSDLG